MCLASCPLECKKTLYKTTLSSSQLNVNNFISKIKNNPKLISDYFNNRIFGPATVKESIVHVNILYDSLSYTQSIESPRMDFVSLLASIGGNLSLFLAVSFFSLFEVIQLFMEIFYFLEREKNRKG